MTRHAWIREVTANDVDGRLILTGAFTVSVDDRQPEPQEIVGWDTAVAWAGDRADVLFHDAEDQRRYTVFAEDPFGDCPPLPAPIEAGLRRGRRRPVRDEWIDQGTADERWEVVVTAQPDRFGPAVVDEAARVGDLLVAALEAAGCDDVSWFDDGLADFSQRDIGEGEGWVAYGPIGIKVTGRAHAARHTTVEPLVVAAVRRALTVESNRWDARVFVQPFGYEAPFGDRYRGEAAAETAPDGR